MCFSCYVQCIPLTVMCVVECRAMHILLCVHCVAICSNDSTCTLLIKVVLYFRVGVITVFSFYSIVVVFIVSCAIWGITYSYAFCSIFDALCNPSMVWLVLIVVVSSVSGVSIIICRHILMWPICGCRNPCSL